MLRSPQSGPATNPSIAGLQSSRDSLPYCGNVIIDDECIINSNRHVTYVKPTNNQIHLFEELEMLRTENFQLRLRIYNAEQRVDRLSAAALERDQKKRSVGTDTNSDGMDTDSDGMDTDSDDMDTDSDDMDTDSDDMDTDSDGTDTDDSNGHGGSGTDQKAKAAKTAVSSIHDLLALNRRLLALMAVTASAKSPSVSSADNKRRWQQLRSHIEEYTVDGPNKEKTNEDDDEFYDASATIPETLGKVTRQNVPPPPSLAPSKPLKTMGMVDEGVGSNVTGLWGQCRPLQSAQQPMKMDLWVPIRKFGKLEQKRCMTQVNTEKSTGQNARAKATTEATVNTIHDLLTLNQRLLALMADTMSAKSVSVSARNRRRLHKLQSHIEEYAVDSPNKEMTTEDNDDNDDSDDEFFYASTISTGTLCKAVKVSVDHSMTRQNVLRSLPPQLPQPTPSTSFEIVDTDDEGVRSEVTRLQGQCRPIRSVHQLMKTELWARNRMLFDRVEQQRIMTQVSYAGVHMDKRLTKKVVAASVAAPPQRHNSQQFRTKTTALTAFPPAAKGILVIVPDAKAPCTTKASEVACTESQTAAASTPLTVGTITTHKSVFPDYSDMDFFISCDEEDDDDDENFKETNCTSSSEEETVDWNDCDEESVLSASIGAPVASSTSRRRHCRTHRPIKSVGDSATFTPTTSSSTESEAMEIKVNELNGDGIIMTEAIATLPCSIVSVGNDLNKRRCSTGGADAANHQRPSSMVDAQVQYDDGNAVADHILSSSDRGIDGELQLQQLRRELDTRRVDNSLLNDMLLRYQQRTRPGDSDPSIPSSSIHEETVHGSIANLLPPLLLAEDDDVGRGDRDHRRCHPDGVEQQLQLQLTRIRKRILGDEHQELNIGEDREDAFNDAVRRMDHADLINVALPQVVERLHRALMVLQHRPENVAAK